jgi:hypothetical protein
MVHAIWIPGWHELDPLLEVGLEDEFVFWRVTPEGFDGPMFYNTLWKPGDGLFASGKIVAIHHPELGEIHKVDTRGLDYTITFADGAELLINAEEEPGKMHEENSGNWIESKRVVSDWRFDIYFESLSELSPESKR